MSPGLILAVAAAYFGVLLGIAWLTGRRADAGGYFLGNRRSPWLVVALGLIGDSLSGVSYVSVPGKVATDRFSYLQVVLGYVLGYAAIAHVLLPVYYRLGLTSIYQYLGGRFGTWAQRTGSACFLVSRLLGSAARLLLAVNVFQTFVFGAWGVPFGVTSALVVLLILAYTLRGGIKTLVWTDIFQSGFLVLGVVLSYVLLARALGWGPADLWRMLTDSPMTRVVVWDWRAPDYFWKQFLSGAAVAVVMTGLDQNNMQKTLSCRSLGEAQRNLHVFTPVMVGVNLVILALGALLYEFAHVRGLALPARTDQLFPLIALQHLGTLAAVVFVLGLTAATFNSADSVLTTLTTSFCLDFLGLEQRAELTEAQRAVLRRRVHVGFAVVLLLVLWGLKPLADRLPVIDLVLKLAGYTYGPLLALFVLGLFTRVNVGGPAVPVICLGGAVVSGWLDANAARWLGGYRLGFELLLVNGALTALGLAVGARVRPAAAH